MTDGDAPPGEGWMPNVGVRPAVGGRVMVQRRSGVTGFAYHYAIWDLRGGPHDILWWRPVITVPRREAGLNAVFNKEGK